MCIKRKPGNHLKVRFLFPKDCIVICKVDKLGLSYGSPQAETVSLELSIVQGWTRNSIWSKHISSEPLFLRKNFVLEKICPKEFSWKHFNPQNLCFEIMLVSQKNFVKKNVSKRNCPKSVVPSNFGSKNIWSPKNVDRKIIVTKFVYKNGQQT